MKPEGTLEAYVMRMEGLYHSLRDNGAVIREYQAMAALVKGLPAKRMYSRSPSWPISVGRASQRRCLFSREWPTEWDSMISYPEQNLLPTS